MLLAHDIAHWATTSAKHGASGRVAATSPFFVRGPRMPCRHLHAARALIARASGRAAWLLILSARGRRHACQWSRGCMESHPAGRVVKPHTHTRTHTFSCAPIYLAECGPGRMALVTGTHAADPPRKRFGCLPQVAHFESAPLPPSAQLRRTSLHIEGAPILGSTTENRVTLVVLNRTPSQFARSGATGATSVEISQNSI